MVAKVEKSDAERTADSKVEAITAIEEAKCFILLTDHFMGLYGKNIDLQTFLGMFLMEKEAEHITEPAMHRVAMIKVIEAITKGKGDDGKGE
jgi:hypothetical protein